MATKWQLRSNRKKSGGMIGRKKKHKKYNRARAPLHITIHENKVISYRTKGGGRKNVLTTAKYANLMIDGKAQKAEIKTVSGNKADKDFIRRNIITKGAVIQTTMGKAVVTSRPGQDGVVNAKLVKE